MAKDVIIALDFPTREDTLAFLDQKKDLYLQLPSRNG